MIWVGGRIVSEAEAGDRAADRALEHGLGLFETLRTWNGHPSLLDRHLERMRRSAELFKFRWNRRDCPMPTRSPSCCGRAGSRGRPAPDHRDGRRIALVGLDGLDAMRSAPP